MTIFESFWSHVEETSSGCWEWQRARTGKNYGALHVGRHQVPAHRHAWELTNGPIPAGLFVCHHCDNPPCVNPNHLFLGTPQDNVIDMVSKGRNPGRRGQGNKLTSEDARRIRLLREEGIRQIDIAREYGIDRSLVSRIASGERWVA